MMQVKIIKQSSTFLERDINEFLKKLGQIPGYKVSLHDIKFTPCDGTDMFIACVIYNQTKANPNKPL